MAALTAVARKAGVKPASGTLLCYHEGILVVIRPRQTKSKSFVVMTGEKSVLEIGLDPGLIDSHSRATRRAWMRRRYEPVSSPLKTN
jgi:hypothetical protein